MIGKKVLLKKIDKFLSKRFGIPTRQNPLPKPIDTLIAAILSQNTNDNNSYRAYKNLKNNFGKWEEIICAKRSQIEKLIQIGGLAKQKSIAIKNLVNTLSERNDINLKFLNELDNSEALNQLTKFEGVGLKTASCVLLFALNRNVCPVDTHVHRTVNRIGIVSEKTPDKTFNSLNNILPDGVAHPLHTNLIRLGREICKQSKPDCLVCPLLKLCKYDAKNFSGSMKVTTKSFMLLDNV
jgi:endonuclease-3